MTTRRVAGLRGFLSSGDDARRGRADRRQKSPQWVGDGLRIDNGQVHVRSGDKFVRVDSKGIRLALTQLVEELNKQLTFMPLGVLDSVQKLLGATGGTASDTLSSVGVAVTDPADTPATADALRDDLVANTIPSIETELTALRNNQASLAAKVNEILTKQK